MQVYASGYTSETGGRGIYLLELDPEKATLEIKDVCRGEANNPCFLTLTRDWVYAVTDIDNHGYISYFRRDPATGRLTFAGKTATDTTALCHITMWPDGKYISMANYRAGNVLVHRILPDGTVGERTAFFQHEGHGYDAANRQAAPHAHSTMVSPDGRSLYVADLGLDKIFNYTILPEGRLEPAPDADQVIAPDGEGPRHFIFSKDGAWLYLVTEMGNQVLVYRKEGTRYELIQQNPTLRPDFTGEDTAADIHMTSDESFLYASNRGENDIAAFRVEEDHTLTLIGHFDCCGDCPRNFCITPDDKYMLVANQFTGNTVLFGIRPDGGLTDKLCEVPTPQTSFVRVMV